MRKIFQEEMNKAMKRTICVAFVLILALALVACGAPADALTGTTWKLTGGEAMDMEMGEDDVEALVGTMTLSFQKGGKVTVELNEQKASSKYTVDGDTVTLSDPSGTMTAKFTDTEMRLDQEQEGVTVTLIFTKQ